MGPDGVRWGMLSLSRRRVSTAEPRALKLYV